MDRGSLLSDWEAGAALESGGVRVIGHRFSRASHDLRDFLARNRVPARWLDVERDAEARQLLKVAGVGDNHLPVALLETARRLRECSPVANSSRWLRPAKPSVPMLVNISSAVRSWSRASR